MWPQAASSCPLALYVNEPSHLLGFPLSSPSSLWGIQNHRVTNWSLLCTFNCRQEARVQTQWLNSVLQVNTGTEFTLVREECLWSQLAGNPIQNRVCHPQFTLWPLYRSQNSLHSKVFFLKMFPQRLNFIHDIIFRNALQEIPTNTTFGRDLKFCFFSFGWILRTYQSFFSQLHSNLRVFPDIIPTFNSLLVLWVTW